MYLLCSRNINIKQFGLLDFQISRFLLSRGVIAADVLCVAV